MLHDVSHLVLVGPPVEAVPGVEHVVQVAHLLRTQRRAGVLGRAPPLEGMQAWRRGPHLVSGADGLAAFELAHAGKLDEAVKVEVVADAQVVAVPAGQTAVLEYCASRAEDTREKLGPPGKVVPLVHVNAVPFVGHNLVEEGLVFRATLVRPLGGERGTAVW